LLAFSLVAACAEARFVLAADSRLPRWFSVPAGLSRSDIRVTLTYYEPPSGRIAVLKMFGENGQLLSEVRGIVRRPRRDARGRELEPTAPVDYPSYEAIVANGLAEFVEHRRREPVFYVTDDPAIKKAFGLGVK
jgi:hypothetical protein